MVKKQSHGRKPRRPEPTDGSHLGTKKTGSSFQVLNTISKPSLFRKHSSLPDQLNHLPFRQSSSNLSWHSFKRHNSYFTTNADPLPNIKSRKPGLVQSVRKKWKKYFSKSKQKKNLKNDDDEKIKVIEKKSKSTENILEKAEKSDEKDEKQGWGIGNMCLEDTKAFDSFMKAVTRCMPYIYDMNEDYDYYGRECQPLHPIYGETMVDVKQFDHPCRPAVRSSFEIDTEASVQNLGGGGDCANAKKPRKSKSVPSKKIRRQLDQFPDFYETVWEFRPKAKHGSRSSIKPEKELSKK